MKSPEGFMLGFLFGFFIMAVFALKATFTVHDANVISKASNLGIFVTAVPGGNLYYWDEVNKVSYKIDTDGLEAIVMSKSKEKK